LCREWRGLEAAQEIRRIVINRNRPQKVAVAPASGAKPDEIPALSKGVDPGLGVGVIAVDEGPVHVQNHTVHKALGSNERAR
jgi:hypothetical protein